MGLFGNEFDTRTVSGDRGRIREQRNNNDSVQLGNIGEMDKGIPNNQDINRINRTLNSDEIARTNGIGDIGEQYSQQDERRGNNGYGDVRREGNRPVQILQRNNDLKIDFSSNKTAKGEFKIKVTPKGQDLKSLDNYEET